SSDLDVDRAVACRVRRIAFALAVSRLRDEGDRSGTGAGDQRAAQQHQAVDSSGCHDSSPTSCLKRKSAAAPFKATHRKVMTAHNVAVMICRTTDNAEPAVHAPPAGSLLQSLRHAQLPAHRR